MRIALPVVLTSEQRAKLEAYARAQYPARVVLRASSSRTDPRLYRRT